MSYLREKVSPNEKESHQTINDGSWWAVRLLPRLSIGTLTNYM